MSALNGLGPTDARILRDEMEAERMETERTEPAHAAIDCEHWAGCPGAGCECGHCMCGAYEPTDADGWRGAFDQCPHPEYWEDATW